MSQTRGLGEMLPLSCSPWALSGLFCASSSSDRQLEKKNQTKLLSVLGPSSGPGISQMLGLLWVIYFKTNGKRGLERLIYPEFTKSRVVVKWPKF